MKHRFTSLYPIALTLATLTIIQPATARPGDPVLSSTDSQHETSIRDTRDSGGPDSFGYFWISNSTAGGPEFDWIEINQLGNQLNLSGLDDAETVNLPWSFPFYGNDYSSIMISTNGYMTFDGNGLVWVNTNIPSSAQPNNCICPMWDDILIDAGGAILTWYDEERDLFIIEWDDVPRYDNNAQHHSFQAILSPYGVITFQYLDLDPGGVNSATVGVENESGTVGLQIGMNGTGLQLENEVAVSIYPPADCDAIDCVGMPETEPNQGWEDGSNNLLRCGELVCATLEDGDTAGDWFLYTHFGGNIEVNLTLSGFDGRLRLVEQEVDGNQLAVANGLPACYNESFSVEALAAGSYYIIVDHGSEPSGLTAIDYSLELTCSGDPCAGHEAITCDGQSEVEPNEGWSADPPNSSYNVIQAGDLICGSLWATDGERDQDWFLLELENAMALELHCNVDALDAALYITDFATEGAVLHAVDDAPACHPETLTVELLPAGSYFVVVTHNAPGDLPEAQNYALSLTAQLPEGEMCSDYTEIGILEGTWSINVEQAPTLAHVNGSGCPSEISSPGLDQVFRMELADPTNLLVELTGEGDADEVILVYADCANPVGSCGLAQNELGGGPDGEALEASDLPAGVYWIVADFAGPGESHPFSLQVSEITIGVDTAAPAAFELLPNHPNPFNPSTTINWKQSTGSPVRFLVHDLSGRRVHDEALGLMGPGTHAITWSANQLPAGVYFLTIEAGSFRDTSKALLLK